jgi:hypothetical protein
MAIVAERAFTIGIYCAVMQALGLLDGLSQVADISKDSVGLAQSTAQLPKHIHLKRSPKPSSHV